MFKKLWEWLLKGNKRPEPQREVPYAEADELLNKGWTLAKEEDTNHIFGKVYLERRSNAGQ